MGDLLGWVKSQPAGKIFSTNPDFATRLVARWSKKCMSGLDKMGRQGKLEKEESRELTPQGTRGGEKSEIHPLMLAR
jgi:hypothetical protein